MRLFSRLRNFHEGGPARGGGLAVLGGAVDGGAKDDLPLGMLDQLGVDPAGRVALVEQLEPGGDGGIAVGIEIDWLGHGKGRREG